MKGSRFKELSSLTDEQLATIAKDGDEDAFQVIVTRYMPLVKNRASRFSSSEIDFDDLVQEGLLGLLKSVQTYDESRKASFAFYADICVSTKLMTAIGSQKTDSRKILGDYLPLEEYDNVQVQNASLEKTQDPSCIFIKKEELEQMHKQARNLLTDFEQSALRLYLSGHSYYEISKVLHTSQKAVDNALQRVRRKLRT